MSMEDVEPWTDDAEGGALPGVVLVATLDGHIVTGKTVDAIAAKIPLVEAYFKEASYGRATLKLHLVEKIINVGDVSNYPNDPNGPHARWEQVRDAAISEWAAQPGRLDPSTVRVALVVVNHPGTDAAANYHPSQLFTGDNLRGRAYVHPENHIGTWVHELSHAIVQLPDYYGGWNSPGPYDVMGAEDGPHPSIYTKTRIGWIDAADRRELATVDEPALPHEPGTSTTVDIQALGTDNSFATVHGARLPLDDKVDIWVEYRKRLGPFEGAHTPDMGGLPTEDAVVVWYTNEHLAIAPHIRQLLGQGNEYTNAEHGIRVTRDKNRARNVATIRIARTRRGLSFPTRGPGALFAKEASLIAEVYTSTHPHRNQPDAVGHLDWAHGKTTDELIRELDDRVHEAGYGLCVDATGKLRFADLYGRAAVGISDYGINLDNREPARWNTEDTNKPDYQYQSTHAMNAIGDNPWSVVRWAQSRYEGLLFFLGERRDRPLRCLYVAESVELGRYGGYTAAARNSTDPKFHWDWVNQVKLGALADELNAKHADLLRRTANQTGDAATIYAHLAVRLNRYGVDHGSADANTLDTDVHARWARTVSVDVAAQELHRRVEGLFATLA